MQKKEEGIREAFKLSKRDGRGARRRSEVRHYYCFLFRVTYLKSINNRIIVYPVGTNYS